MDALLLLVLLVLPFAAAGLIVGVASVRRRRHAGTDGQATQGVHRLQADAAAVQDAAVQRTAPGPAAPSGRQRRAESATRPSGR